MRTALGPEPERTRQHIRLEHRFQHCLQRGLHNPVTDRGNGQWAILPRLSRLGNQHPTRRQWPVPAVPQFHDQFAKKPGNPVLLNLVQSGLIDTRSTVVTAHRDPRPPQDVPAPDFVPQRVKPSSRIGLGRPVQRMLQGTNRIYRFRSHNGGTSHCGHSPGPSMSDTTHRRSSGPSLTAGCVVLSAQSVLLPPPTPFLPATHFPACTGYRAPCLRWRLARRPPGRGGPLQFPPSLSERSAPLTPGSPSRLHLQDLHRFHGLHPEARGSALPLSTLRRDFDDAAGFA